MFKRISMPAEKNHTHTTSHAQMTLHLRRKCPESGGGGGGGGGYTHKMLYFNILRQNLFI